DAHATGIGEALADAAADEAPCHAAEVLGVEIAQVDDVDGHEGEASMNSSERSLPRSCGPARVAPASAKADDPAAIERASNSKDGALTMPAQTRLFLCLKDNYGVLLHDPQTGATAAIDAPEAAPIEAALKDTGWRLTDILVTHHHADHTGGIAELKER